jgi:hypothetical protein
MPRREIPAVAIAVCAEFLAERETHSELDNLFSYAGAPGDPPEGNKLAKANAWLRRVNKNHSVDPLRVLGRLVERYMEEPFDAASPWLVGLSKWRAKFTDVLGEHSLQYARGGHIVTSLGVPTRTLQEFIQDRNLAAIESEFDRAAQNTENEPREAVSAASNILESVCKVYIEDNGLEMPAKQDLQSVWNAVRKDLGLDPSHIEDRDLQSILSGIISVVHGIGALRTHASSAHGAGRKLYRLEPRHARLAVHAAHTLTLFILESWETKSQKQRPT